ncbi:hypothetical protein BDN70DRAFT_945406 [Pholiota conissans]|uniref:Monopolin complex subunit Csm1/Pcs1 C-terminal domain-containing protein n=1 Tax=Pholiota conissans TaxID=109636 RepID=A0A9P5ZF08_9AGAR|nr:hypothetical protein BDN70DRAFT_945406 [Pholiota conissans]
MSESGDDLGGFGAATPHKSNPVAASAKPGSSRRQAGPSKTAGSNTAAARKKATAVDESDIEEAQQPPAKKIKAAARARKQQEQEVDVEEDDVADQLAEDIEMDGGDIQEIEPPRNKPKGRPASKKPTSQSIGANGNATNTLASAAAKGKGKAKAKPPPKARQTSVEEVDIELIEEADEPMDVEEVEPATAKPAIRGTKIARPHPRSTAKQDAEIARLQEALKQADTHIADMKRQLTELSTVRYTEPEQLLERIDIQHQATLKAKELLIEDLKTKLAQSDPLLRSGKKAVFEILTRDEANKEMEKLNAQVKAYKEALLEQTQSLKDKDERIKTLEQENSDLKYELKAEIERSSSLLAKSQRQPMSSGPRSHGAIIGTDPKMTELIKFYEDLSNLIVPNIKVQPGRYLKTEESILSCCYTYRDVTNPAAASKSIYFSLRLCKDLRPGFPDPPTSSDQLTESVHYVPIDLDKEPPEFVASLGFLGDTFTFERNQLSLFLRTLYEYISGEGDKGGHEEDSDDSVVVME